MPPPPTRADDVPIHIAVPAFMVSELTTAFRMGLFIFIPLLLIDLLVSAVLMAVLAVIPGIPAFPFLIMAGTAGFFAYNLLVRCQ